jgi:Tol biopolymer transport system component
MRRVQAETATSAPAKVGGRRRRAGMAPLVGAVALAVGLAGCAVPRWQSDLASVNSAGNNSGDGSSWSPELSVDGTMVVFESRASNLGASDTNGDADVYVRDLATGENSLVSVNATGTDSGDDVSRFPQLSPDGSKVVFMSHATNLASPATDGRSNLFVRDLATGTTSLVSVNAAGTGGGDAGVFTEGEFDPTGTRVLFGSDSHNLVPSDPGGPTAIFERNLATGVTRRLAEGLYGSYSPSGDAIAFVGGGHVWLRAASTGTVTQVSTGLPGSTGSGRLVFSTDGTKLAFERRVSTSPVRTDIYVHDRVARTTRRVTTAASGTGGSNNTPSHVYGFDPTNANRLLFSSTASNLVTNDANGYQEDVFVRNLSTNFTRLVTVTSGGAQSGPGRSTEARWVGDGTKIAFLSRGNQFGPTDTNGVLDVYVRDETARSYRLVSINAAGDNSGNAASGEYRLIPEIGFFVNELSVSSSGARIAYGSDANNLGAADGNRTDNHDVYVARLVTPPS